MYRDSFTCKVVSFIVALILAILGFMFAHHEWIEPVPDAGDFGVCLVSGLFGLLSSFLIYMDLCRHE